VEYTRANARLASGKHSSPGVPVILLGWRKVNTPLSASTWRMNVVKGFVHSCRPPGADYCWKKVQNSDPRGRLLLLLLLVSVCTSTLPLSIRFATTRCTPVTLGSGIGGMTCGHTPRLTCLLSNSGDGHGRRSRRNLVLPVEEFLGLSWKEEFAPSEVIRGVKF